MERVGLAVVVATHDALPCATRAVDGAGHRVGAVHRSGGTVGIGPAEALGAGKKLVLWLLHQVVVRPPRALHHHDRVAEAVDDLRDLAVAAVDERAVVVGRAGGVGEAVGGVEPVAEAVHHDVVERPHHLAVDVLAGPRRGEPRRTGPRRAHKQGNDGLAGDGVGAGVPRDRLVVETGQRSLLEVIEHQDRPAHHARRRRLGDGAGVGQLAEGRDVVLKRQADLPHVVGATGAPCRLTSRLHGRKKEPHKGADDGDHHEQFDEGERARPSEG